MWVIPSAQPLANGSHPSGVNRKQAISNTQGGALRLAAEFRNARRTMHADECARMADDLALPQVHLPLIAGSQLSADDIEKLADALLRVSAP